MPGIVYGCITPHPPILLPHIGRGRETEVSQTIQAMGQVSRDLSDRQVSAALIVSPHGSLLRDAMGVLRAPYSEGTMAHWGAPGVDYRFDNDFGLVEALQEQADNTGVPLKPIGDSIYLLDHGVMVPMYFLFSALTDRPLVPLSFSALDFHTHVDFGRAIARAAYATGKRLAFIASADLSHRLIPGAPAGFDPFGQEFDRRVTEAVASMRVDHLLSMDADIVSRAGECGFRSILILMGVLESAKVQPRVLAYEGPFGVGYLTASFDVKED